MRIPAAQIFTANPRRHSPGLLSPTVVDEFNEHSAGVLWLSHCSYLINLASCRPDVQRNSGDDLDAELARCSQLALPFCVLHPGSAAGQEREQALARTASALRHRLENRFPAPVLLLENTSGAGSSLCGNLEELRDLLQLIGLPGRTGVCIDTAHAHGYGYRLDSPGAAMDFCAELISLFGSSLMAFHINDSKAERGSGRDRHERPGNGTHRP